MADKLSESSWTAFTAKNKLSLDDKALVKALAAVDKAGDEVTPKRVEALEAAVDLLKKQVPALAKVKKQVGDKPFDLAKDKVYELLELAERQHRAAVAELARNEAADEEEETPVLLTTKMLPLVRELRKGEVVMHVMVCHAGKHCAVLIMRKPISPSRRKLLAESLESSAGAKYLTGEVVFEAGALHFTLMGSIGGLAKRFTAALLAQLGLRLKVRLRGEDGVEEDGENEDEGYEDEQAADAGGSATATGEPVPSAEQLAYEQRLPKVVALIDKATAARHPDTRKFGPLLDFATAKADENGDYAVALKALQTLEALIAGRPVGGASGGSADAAAAEEARYASAKARLAGVITAVTQGVAAGAANAAELKVKAAEAGGLLRDRKIDAALAAMDAAEALLPTTTSGSTTVDDGEFRKRWSGAATAWRDAVETVDAQIERLQAALREMDDAELKEIAEFGLPAVTGNHKARLMAAMMDIDRSQGDGLKKAAAKTARLASSFDAYLAASEAVAATDENPFGVKVGIRATIGPALKQMQQALAAMV